MATDNFLIQLGLPQLPDDNIPPDLYDNFFQLHRAIQNLLRGVSRYCGIDEPDPSTWSELNPTDTLLAGNLTRLYIETTVAVARGQTVNIFNSSGAAKVRLADATATSAVMCHGVANSAGAIGEVIEVKLGPCLIDSIGGLIPGSTYWQSTTAGVISNAAPGPTPMYRQMVGVALSPTLLWFNPPFYSDII